MFLEDVLSHVIQGGDTVFDVGAHVGMVASHMATCAGARAKIYSFEPHPEKFAALKARAELLPNLSVFNYAVSDSTAPVALYYGVISSSDQASTICKDLATPSRLGEDVRSIEVQATTLDNFCAERKLRPEVVKIDVEGAESLVFKGADEVLATTPLLIFELGTATVIPGYVNSLRQRGYALYMTEIYQFISDPPSWDHTLASHTQSLKDCILSFTKEEALPFVPFSANVMAAIPGKHDNRLARFRKLSLADAAKDFADPKKT